MSYVFSIPNQDTILDACMRILPESLVYKMFRKRNIFLKRSLYKVARISKANVFVLTSKYGKTIG